MPPHETYVELFAGSGVVLREKPKALESFAVDLNPEPLAMIRAAVPEANCIEQSAFDFLSNFDYGARGRVLIYADPPYLLSTRTSRHRYRHEFTERDHVR